MSTWIEQLSTWMEHRDPLSEPERDATVLQMENLIDLSYEIQEAYTCVVEKLDERSRASQTENC